MNDSNPNNYILDFSNIQTFLSYLLTVRTQILQQLNDYLSNYIELNIRSLYNQAYLINKHETLKTFQLTLCRISVLPASQLDEDYRKCCEILSDEVLTIVKRDIRHLNDLYALIVYLKEHQKFPSSELKYDIIDTKDFLYRCYICTARRLWNQPELLSHKYSPELIAKNRIQLKQIISDGISDIVNHFIKLDDFYHQFSKIVSNTTLTSPLMQSGDIAKQINDESSVTTTSSDSTSTSSDSTSTSSTSIQKDVVMIDRNPNDFGESQKVSINQSGAAINEATSEIKPKSEDKEPNANLDFPDAKMNLPLDGERKGSLSPDQEKLPSEFAKGELPHEFANQGADGKLSLEISGQMGGEEKVLLPIGLKNPLSTNHIRIPAKDKLIFNSHSPYPVTDKFLLKLQFKPTSLNVDGSQKKSPKPKGILKTKQIKKIEFRSPSPRRTQQTIPPDNQSGKTPTTISTISMPKMNLLNSAHIITDISSNQSDSFQLSPCAAQQAQLSPAKSPEHIVNSTKSNLFSVTSLQPTRQKSYSSIKQVVHRPSSLKNNKKNLPIFDFGSSNEKQKRKSQTNLDDSEIERINHLMKLDFHPSTLLDLADSKESRSLNGERIEQFHNAWKQKRNKLSR